MGPRLLLLALVLGCGPGPDFRSSAGVSYYWRGSNWEPGLIEAQEGHFLGRLATLKRFPDIGPTLELTQVLVYGEPIPCQMSPSGYCNGFQDGSIIHVRDMGCPFNSALTHEITHWLQQRLKNVTDYQHQDLPLWEAADSHGGTCP